VNGAIYNMNIEPLVMIIIMRNLKEPRSWTQLPRLFMYMNKNVSNWQVVLSKKT